MHNRRKVTVSDRGLSASLDGNRPAGLCGGTEGHGHPRSRALLEFGRCGPAGVGWEPERSQVHLVAPQGAERLLAVGAGPAAVWTSLLPTPCSDGSWLPTLVCSRQQCCRRGQGKPWTPFRRPRTSTGGSPGTPLSWTRGVALEQHGSVSLPGRGRGDPSVGLASPWRFSTSWSSPPSS